MSFKKAPAASTTDYELPPGGSYPAIFIGLIDLGTQTWEYNNKKNESHKIYFLWELTSEKNSEGNNFVVGADYTFSLHEKANLRKMVESYNGKPLDPEKEIDIMLLIGKPCVLSLTEGKSSNDKAFVEVTGVARPIKGQNVPTASRKPYIFDFEFHPDFKQDPPIPDWVPMLYGRSIIEEIKKSPEWKAGSQISIPASGNGVMVGAASTMDSDSPF